MLYAIVVVIVIIALLSRKVNKQLSCNMYLIAVFLLMLVCGLRNAFLYPDISDYYYFFLKGDTNDFDTFGIGYATLNSVCRWLSNSFQFYLFVVSIIVVWGYGKFIKDYSPYMWLSLLLFIIINYYPSFFILRQYLSMAVILFSIKYIIKRDLILFSVATIIAFSFHTTAIVVFPLYFLYGLKNTKLNMALLLAGSVMAILLFLSLGDFINIYSAYYAHYFEESEEVGAWQRALMKVFVFVIYIYTLKSKFYEEGINRIVFYCMVFNVVICIAAMKTQAAYRLRDFFSLADFIGIPIIVYYAKRTKPFKRSLVYLLMTFYVVLLVISFNRFIQSENMNNKYEFFWESSNPQYSMLITY